MDYEPGLRHAHPGDFLDVYRGAHRPAVHRYQGPEHERPRPPWRPVAYTAITVGLLSPVLAFSQMTPTGQQVVPPAFAAPRVGILPNVTSPLIPDGGVDVDAVVPGPRPSADSIPNGTEQWVQPERGQSTVTRLVSVQLPAPATDASIPSSDSPGRVEFPEVTPPVLPPPLPPVLPPVVVEPPVLPPGSGGSVPPDSGNTGGDPPAPGSGCEPDRNGTAEPHRDRVLRGWGWWRKHPSAPASVKTPAQVGHHDPDSDDQDVEPVSPPPSGSGGEGEHDPDDAADDGNPEQPPAELPAASDHADDDAVQQGSGAVSTP